MSKKDIQALLKKLSSNHYLVRKHAIQALPLASVEKEEQEEILQDLFVCLNDSNGEVRKAALTTLDELLHHRHWSFQTLEHSLRQEISDFLNHRDPEVRAHAVGILTVLTIRDQSNGKVHGTALVSKILSVFDDPHPPVRVAALEGLVELAKIGASLRTAVDNILEFVVREEEAYRRWQEGRWGEKESPGDKLRNRIRRAFSEMVAACEKGAGKADFIMGLNQLLDDPDKEETAVVIDHLRDIYEPSLEEELRSEIFRRLLYFGLHTQIGTVEEAVGRALKSILRQEGMNSAVIQRFFYPRRENSEEFNLFHVAYSGEGKSQRAFWAARLLGVILEGQDLPDKILSVLHANLAREDRRRASLVLIREIGRSNESMAEAFATEVMNLCRRGYGDVESRVESAKTLGRLKIFGSQREEITRLLIELLNDGEGEVKMAAARSLEKWGKKDQQVANRAARSLLRGALSDNSWSRIFAEVLGVFLQGELASREGLLEILQKGLDHPTVEVRENAFWLLSEMVGKSDQDWNTETILEAIHSTFHKRKNPFLRRQIVQTLTGLYHHPSFEKRQMEMVALLIDALEDPHLLVSEAASLSLNSIFDNRNGQF